MADINVITGNLTVSGTFTASGFAFLPSGYTNLSFSPLAGALTRIYLNNNGTVSTAPSSLSTGTRVYIPFPSNYSNSDDLSRHIRTQKITLLTGNSASLSLRTPVGPYINETGITLPFNLATGPQFIGAGYTVYNIDERFNHIEQSGIFALKSGEKIGFGTYQPTEKVHVNGNLRIAGNINPRTDNFILNLTGNII